MIATFLERDEIVGVIIKTFDIQIQRSFVALTETGDLIFLIAERPSDLSFFIESSRNRALRAQIHYNREHANQWQLTFCDFRNDNRSHFKFYVPDRIMKIWAQYSLDRNVAIDLKERYFSRIFIFTTRYPSLNLHPSRDEQPLPFLIANIDRDWLNNIRDSF